MDNITLGQVFDAIIRLSTLAAAVGGLYALLMNGIKKLIVPLEIKRLKSDLATLFYLAENGDLSNEQRMLTYEEYDEYSNKYKQNSWVHEKFESLKKEGKL